MPLAGGFARDGECTAAPMHSIAVMAVRSALLGKGHIAMTIDQGARYGALSGRYADRRRYASPRRPIAYFDQSEQIPTVDEAGDRTALCSRSTGRGLARGRCHGAVHAGRGRQCASAARKMHHGRSLIAMSGIALMAFIDTSAAGRIARSRRSARKRCFTDLFHEDGVRVLRSRNPCERNAVASGDAVAAVLGRYSEENDLKRYGRERRRSM